MRSAVVIFVGVCSISFLWLLRDYLNTMMVDKAFCKSTDGSFGRRITYRKGKSITKISIYTNKDKVSLLQRKWPSSIVNLPPGCWLTTSGDGTITGAQCWSLFLEDLALRNNIGKSALVRGSPCMLLSPYITCISPSWPICSWAHEQ